MRSLHPDRRLARSIGVLLVASGLFWSTSAQAQQSEDDIFLFTSSVAPNVLIQLDNSTSMNHIVWHPAFDPSATYDCAAFNPALEYNLSSSGNYTFCGRTRRLYHDTASVGDTLYDGRYLNWIFSSANTVQAEINDNNNGVRLCQGAGSPTYARYQLNRLSVAKRIVVDTMCEFNATKTVRFGLSIFRDPIDVLSEDPNGGYVQVAINDSSPSHASDLEASILNTKPNSATPLAEALFQNYTYFMSRNPSDLPAPATSGTFPTYRYKETPSGGGGEYTTSSSQYAPDPIEYSCQKNFVIVVTDGFPTRDDFDTDPVNTSRGFADFSTLIGDYNADGETEVPVSLVESTLYLDDVAKFMHETDCRPDLVDDQTLDIYTIGFTTDGAVNDLLQKTAQVGNGLFYTSDDPEELRAQLMLAINDIIEKAQSFTAATVPSTRTSAGGSFYTSFFLPLRKTAFWEGHLRAFRIDAVGNVFGQGGVCAFLDPDPGECNSGPQNPAVTPFWDAGEEVPAPASRNLYTSELSAGVATRVDFDLASLTAADLSIQPFASPPAPAPNPSYLNSAALTAEGLADEIISYTRGCEFGTGVVGGADVAATQACVERLWLLGDIFHSGPAVVTAPRSVISDPSYAAFKTAYATRKRVLYAGANDGFLHAFDAGALNTLVIPNVYLDGTGEELFGYMPWEARRNIKNKYIDDPTARTYYVDGSPQVVDVWLRSSATDTTKAASEWRTVLVGGMRQGGRIYYALDITNPAAAGYPGLLWEFPNESDPDSTAVATSILPYLGESWSKPIITRVKVRIDADDNGGQGYERWVAIVSGGYSADGDPNLATYDPNAIAGRSLLMIDVASGELLAMKRYDSGASDAQQYMDYAIPSTPAVADLDFDGYADVVYIGDTGGQVFKWVIRAIGEDRVNDSSAAGTYTQPNWPFKRFFTAPITSISGTNYYKSFFYPPQLVYVNRRLYVTFGSGERMNIGFMGIANQDENNRFYSMTDLDPYEMAVSPYATLTESNLVDLTTKIKTTCADVPGRGFYFKVGDGEKFVTNPEVFRRYVFAATFEPTTSADPCTSKGLGRLYAFRVDCQDPYFTDGSGNEVRSVDLGEGMPTDPQVSVGVNGGDNRIYIEKSGADLESIGAPDLDLDDGSLLYWREVTQ